MSLDVAQKSGAEKRGWVGWAAWVIELRVMVNIYLVGFMGAGKTSIGEPLAAKLGAHFVDLDERLAGRFGCTISEVFVDRGEAFFRAAETEELKEVALETGHVVATGGGAFASEENRRIIETSGVSVYLEVPWAALGRRLAGDNGRRPMYEGEAQTVVDAVQGALCAT